MSDTLHVFSNGNDYCVAKTAEEALAFYRAYFGPMGLEPVDDETAVFLLQPDGQKLSISSEESGDFEIKSCGEWAALKGAGYLCSHEW